MQIDAPIKRHQLLRQTFIHLKGIGPRTERRLWQAGIRDWNELAQLASRQFRGRRLMDVESSLELSLLAWERSDLYYFQRALPAQERWRLIPGAYDTIAYLDIEASDGGLPPLAHSTAVGFYFKGDILQEYEPEAKRRLLERILNEAQLLCTFNGGAYDIPFLAAEFKTPIRIAHLDLCPWLRSQGYKGGLKAIQKSLPHLHQRSSLDLDGYDAVRLWRLHQDGVPGALETLLTYNAEDILILEPLLREAYQRERDKWPELTLPDLPQHTLPDLSTRVDPSIYARLKKQANSVTA